MVRVKRSRRLALPKYVCSLDLETTKTSFDTPGRSTLLFVGTREYFRDGRGFKCRPHKVWMPDDLPALQSYLSGFKGLILGHNILKFDYQVLRPHVRLEGVIEKTVDTLALCWWRRWHTHFDPAPDILRYISWRVGPELGKLGLDNLGRRNLRSGKTMDPKMMQRTWLKDREAVFKYNAQDCALAFRLWLRMVQRQRISIMPGVGFVLSPEGAWIATGQAPWVRFSDWDVWRSIEFLQAEPGEPDWLPMKRCPRCGDWKNWRRFDEISSGSDWTDGQIAEWMTGTWGTAYCGACGLVMDWDDGEVSFDLEAKPFVRTVRA